MKIRTKTDLEKMREKGLKNLYPKETKVSVGMATCGLRTGGVKVMEAIQNELEKGKLPDTTGTDRLYRFLPEGTCGGYFRTRKAQSLLSRSDP